jgi:hypothetical protein
MSFFERKNPDEDLGRVRSISPSESDGRLTRVVLEVKGQELPVSPTLTRSETLLDPQKFGELPGVTRFFEQTKAISHEDSGTVFFTKDQRPPEARTWQNQDREYGLTPNQNFENGSLIRRVYVRAGGFIRLKWMGAFDKDGKETFEKVVDHDENGFPSIERKKQDGKLFEEISYVYESGGRLRQKTIIKFSVDGSRTEESILKYSPKKGEPDILVEERTTLFVTTDNGKRVEKITKETNEIREDSIANLQD